MDVGTRIIGVAFAILLGSAVAVAGETQSWHYYYFKEKRPLKLDPSRIAVLRDASDAASTEGAALSANGLDVATAERLAIPGWSIVAFQEDGTTASAVRQTVGLIATQRATDFVSPVFIGEDGGPVIVTPVILVRFMPEIHADRADVIVAESKAGAIIQRNWANMKGAYRLRSSARDGFEVLAAANRLAVLPEVKYAEPDMIFTGRGALTPNDPGFSSCWGLHNTGQFGGIPDMDMDAPEAWDTTTGDSSILVVIIDTGVQQDHPDIHQLTPGTDTTTDAGDGGPVNACDNHGTPVAGCVSATINNSLGTVGVAPGCRSASARTFISTLDCSGSWNSTGSWTVDALAWAESIGARVTNNSNFETVASLQSDYPVLLKCRAVAVRVRSGA